MVKDVRLEVLAPVGDGTSPPAFALSLLSVAGPVALLSSCPPSSSSSVQSRGTRLSNVKVTVEPMGTRRLASLARMRDSGQRVQSSVSMEMRTSPGRISPFACDG